MFVLDLARECAQRLGRRVSVVCVGSGTRCRVLLFNRMREKLAAAGVEPTVAYGDPLPAERLKSDSGELPRGRHVPCHYGWGGRLCWQNAMPLASSANLVVVTQENRLLFNYLRSILKMERK